MEDHSGFPCVILLKTPLFCPQTAMPILDCPNSI